MKKLIVISFIISISISSCSSDDNSNDGKCSGHIKIYNEDYTYFEVDVTHDCSECFKLTTWTCPEPGTCEYESITGTFECNQ